MSAFSAASLTAIAARPLAVVAATAAAQEPPVRPSTDQLPVELSTFLAVGGLDTSSTGVTARMPIKARLSFEAKPNGGWRTSAASAPQATSCSTCGSQAGSRRT